MKRVLIIIGVNGTLGKGATEVLLNKDYDLFYLCDRKPIKFDINGKSIKTIKIGDLSKEDEVKNLFKSIDVEKNTQYFLYSTVGGFCAGKIGEIDYTAIEKCININFISSVLISKHFYKLVEKSQSGSICFTSALAAEKPSEGKSVYGASKAALNYFTSTLAIEGEQINLTANIVAPFALDTPENREWMDDSSKLISPENIGEMVDKLFKANPVKNGEVIRMPDNIE